MAIRVAVRAIILQHGRLLLVNAFPGAHSDLWCAPGGGAEPGMSLPDNLAREVHEETGLSVRVGAPAFVNEFHSPGHGFHQVELFFHCRITGGQLAPEWRDPAGIVSRRRFVTRDEMRGLRFKPDRLELAAFEGWQGYDPLEPLVHEGPLPPPLPDAG